MKVPVCQAIQKRNYVQKPNGFVSKKNWKSRPIMLVVKLLGGEKI
jgi:hypothetical protein